MEKAGLPETIEDKKTPLSLEEKAVAEMDGLLGLLKAATKESLKFRKEVGQGFRISAFRRDEEKGDSYFCGGESELVTYNDKLGKHAQNAHLILKYNVGESGGRRNDLSFLIFFETSEAFPLDPSTDKPWKSIKLSVEETAEGKNRFPCPESQLNDKNYREAIDASTPFQIEVYDLDTDSPKVRQFKGVRPYTEALIPSDSGHLGATKFGLEVIEFVAKAGRIIFDEATSLKLSTDNQ